MKSNSFLPPTSAIPSSPSTYRDFLELAKHWHVAGRTHTGIIHSKEFALSKLVRRVRHLVIHHRDQDLTNKVLWLAAHDHRPSR